MFCKWFRRRESLLFLILGYSATCIHWQVSQATSLYNIVFNLSSAAGTRHRAVQMENGRYASNFITHLSLEPILILGLTQWWFHGRSHR